MPKLLTYGLIGLGGVLTYKVIGNVVEGRRKLKDNHHVVIVGGGYAGITLANDIKGKGKYTLVDPKDSLHHNMAFPRAAVLPGFSEKTFIPYQPTFGDNFVQGRVTGVDSQNKIVYLDGDKNIAYDDLVFATGSGGYFPAKCDDSKSTSYLKNKFDEYANMVSKSKKIVIIGGGAVGIEMAGEIADVYPNIEVTVIHSGPKIIGKDLLPKAETKLLEALKKMNINLVLEDKVKNLSTIPTNILQDSIKVETGNGLEFDVNMVIPCIGLKPNSAAYSTDLAESVNDVGQLKVDSNLRVVGQDNIFAIGDCNDVKCVKLEQQSEHQAHYLWDTLLRIDEGKALNAYTPDTMRMVVPLGTKHGIAQNGNAVLGDFGAKMIKGKDVFCGMIWKAMGQSVPKK